MFNREPTSPMIDSAYLSPGTAGHTLRARINDGAAANAGRPASEAPLVSVVMTVYNTRKYAAASVESVLAQTFTDFELIIIDDGSTDGSDAILQSYAASHPRIRLTRRPNTGIVRAANEGIAQARGMFLARMDSDDLCVPERFERQVAYLHAHPRCSLLGSRVMQMDPYGSPVVASGQKLTHPEIEQELLQAGGGWAVVQPSAMMPLAAVKDAGGYRGSINMSEDHDLFLRLAERGEVANLPELLLWYRRHYNSVTHTQYEQAWGAKERLLREAYERRGRSFPADWEYQPWRPPEQSVQLRAWGWAALKAGNIHVARRHASAAVRAEPASVAAWKLLWCAMRPGSRVDQYCQ